MTSALCTAYQAFAIAVNWFTDMEVHNVTFHVSLSNYTHRPSPFPIFCLFFFNVPFQKIMLHLSVPFSITHEHLKHFLSENISLHCNIYTSIVCRTIQILWEDQSLGPDRRFCDNYHKGTPINSQQPIAWNTLVLTYQCIRDNMQIPFIVLKLFGV